MSAVGRTLWFFQHDGYSRHEATLFIFNYFHLSLNTFLLYGLGVGVLLALGLLIYHRLEGLIIAGVLVVLPLLPLVYYLNKHLFPGRFHPVSLAGNGAFLLLAAGLAIWLFLRKTRDWRFIHIFNRNASLVAAILVILAVNVLYSFQPDETKLKSAPGDPQALLHLFRDDAFGIPVQEVTPQAVQKYFAAIAEKRLKLLPQRISRKDTADILAEADAAISHTFHLLNVSHTFPDGITWHENPTNDREWLFALNRMDWMWSVAVAYHFTGDSKYARAFDEIMRSWFAQNNLPKWKDEDDYVWRLIETSARVTDGWIEAFYLLYNCPEVSDEVKWQMLASFHDHAQFLAYFRSPQRNHLLQETYGLLAVGAAFPEFKMSREWIDLAKMRLDRAMREDVYPDGGYNEGSTYYHRFAIRILQEIADFAEAYGVRLSDFFYEQLEKMYDFLMYTARPDGVMPQMNDGFHAKNLRIMFDAPARQFGRDDFLFFASDGLQGRMPLQNSVDYPYSGIYVMRSNWRQDARYMLIDAGLFGSSHGHEDKLSFELFAYGKPFIVESGTFTYVPNRWRRYFTGSFAHNTIVIDGRSQIRFSDRDRWVNAPPETLANKWISNFTFDYLSATYDQGYGRVKEDVLTGIVHTRHWLFVKQDYWLIWDVIEGAGEHEVAQLFHFDPEVQVSQVSPSEILAAHENGPELVLASSPQPIDLALVKGEEDPIQGWVSSEYGAKEPAFAAIFKQRNQLPLAFVTGLFPFPGKPDSVPVNLLPLECDGRQVSQTRAIAVEISSAAGHDFILIAPGLDGSKTFSDLRTDAQLMIVRRFWDGTEKKTALTDL